MYFKSMWSRIHVNISVSIKIHWKVVIGLLLYGSENVPALKLLCQSQVLLSAVYDRQRFMSVCWSLCKWSEGRGSHPGPAVTAIFVINAEQPFYFSDPPGPLLLT